MTHALDDLQLHHLIGQQMKRPSCLPTRRVTLRRRNQCPLAGFVENPLPRRPGSLLPAQRCLQPLGHKQTPDALNRVHVNVQRLRNLLVSPPRPILTLIHFQQDLSSDTLLRRHALLSLHYPSHTWPLVPCQPHEVSLARHRTPSRTFSRCPMLPAHRVKLERRLVPIERNLMTTRNAARIALLVMMFLLVFAGDAVAQFCAPPSPPPAPPVDPFQPGCGGPGGGGGSGGPGGSGGGTATPGSGGGSAGGSSSGAPAPSGASCDLCKGSPCAVATGNYTSAAFDLQVVTPGFPLVVSRTYESARAADARSHGADYDRQPNHSLACHPERAVEWGAKDPLPMHDTCSVGRGSFAPTRHPLRMTAGCVC